MISLPFSDFSGGLNLRDASGVLDPKYAIDALNVEFGPRGAIVQRFGYDNFTSSGGAADYDCLHPYYESDGTKQLMSGRGAVVEVINTSGASVATQATSTSPHYFARFAAPGSELCYIGNGTDKIFKWNGTAFTAPASMGTVPLGKFLAVQPWDNRLVTAGFNTSTGGPSSAATNPSTVWWSDVGDPETWNAANYVHLTPGDGESIMGIVAWDDKVYVFKETKFFVFYNTATDATGGAEFLYREVKGAGLASSRALVAGRDGVYFLSRTGIYRTTGGAAEQVSDNIDALFTGELPDFYTGSAISQANITKACAGYFNERLYFGVPTGTNSYCDRTLVFDPRHGWWTIHSIPAAAMATWRPSNSEELMFAYATGDNHIGRHSTGYTNDDGTAITAKCRLGWFAPVDGRHTSLRQMRVWGSGYLTAQASTNYNVGAGVGVTYDLDSVGDVWGGTWGSGSGSDTWGPTTAFDTRLMRGFGAAGRYFSLQFSNNVLDRELRLERVQADFVGSRV